MNSATPTLTASSSCLVGWRRDLDLLDRPSPPPPQYVSWLAHLGIGSDALSKTTTLKPSAKAVSPAARIIPPLAVDKIL